MKCQESIYLALLNHISPDSESFSSNVILLIHILSSYPASNRLLWLYNRTGPEIFE